MSDSRHVISLRYEDHEKEPPRVPPPIRPQGEWPRGWIFGGIAFVIFILLSWSSVHFGWVGKRAVAPAATTTAAAANETGADDPNALIREVGSLILLPQGEVPTVATVTDPSKLQGQQFFSNARVGDKVLIYTQAKKAYLYRPSLHLLVEVAPITTDALQ